MPAVYVLEELRAYLIAQGVAQPPSATVSTSLPSVWLQPRDGSPLPRDGENITITLTTTLQRVVDRLEPWLSEAFVDVIVRSRTALPGLAVQTAILDLVVPMDSSLGGRKNWDMGSLRVECSDVWRGDQPLPQRQRIGETDPHRTYDRVQSFRFLVRRKRLAGLSIP